MLPSFSTQEPSPSCPVEVAFSFRHILERGIQDLLNFVRLLFAPRFNRIGSARIDKILEGPRYKLGLRELYHFFIMCQRFSLDTAISLFYDIRHERKGHRIQCVA